MTKNDLTQIEVKYKNQINGLDFRKLNPGELNVAMSIFSTLKNQETRDVTLNYDKFRSISKITTKDFSNKEIETLIKNTFTKIGAGNLIVETDKSFTMFPLFDKLHIDKENGLINYRVSEMFVDYFNYFLKEYTSFPLIEFVSLKGKYAKNLYRLLMQYKNTGFYREEYNSFLYETLGAPKTILRKKCNNQIITPAIKELKELGCFKDISCSFVKEGKEIKDIIFNFSVIRPNPENINNINDPDLKKSIQELEEERQRNLEETIRIAKTPWLDDDRNVVDSEVIEAKNNDDDLPF